MSDRHKAALAAGRDDSRAVRRYLEALEAGGEKPAKRRNVAALEEQLAETVESLNGASAIERVLLAQRRLDLDGQIVAARRNPAPDMAELEEAFVAALPGYSARKHISYAAWREVGVPARVLRAAGIRR